MLLWAVSCIGAVDGGKNFRLNLQGKFVSASQDTKCTSQAEQESIFMTFFAGQGRFGALFSRFRPSFEDDDWKKGRQLLGGKKCTPDKILATPMEFCRHDCSVVCLPQWNHSNHHVKVPFIICLIDFRYVLAIVICRFQMFVRKQAAIRLCIHVGAGDIKLSGWLRSSVCL